MLSLARLFLMAALLSVSNMVYRTEGATVSLHLTAYARKSGDFAAWQMCNLKPGITVAFTHNPSRAGIDRNGIVADRTRLDIHVEPSVKPGRYYLIFISYSFVDGPSSGALAIGYHPVLRVLPNHAIQIPPFNHWYYIPDPAPEDIAPPDTCSRLPASSSLGEATSSLVQHPDL